MDYNGLNQTTWIEIDQNGLNRIEVDKIRPNKTEWTKQDQNRYNGLNKADVDKIRPKWTEQN